MKPMKDKIKGFYDDVMKAEKMFPVPLIFCRVGKGGACVSFNPITKRIYDVQMDINRCKDPGYAILHEIAHVKMLSSKGYPGHNASFRKEENRLVEKYMNSDLEIKHFA
jgi:hypothetical protein